MTGQEGSISRQKGVLSTEYDLYERLGAGVEAFTTFDK
jgi:hypothetical protein